MKHKLIGLFLLILSILELLGGCYFYFDTKTFLSTAESASGTIVELVEKSSSDGSTYAPVFTFKDTLGTTHKVESSVSSSPAAYSVNEKIKVFYLSKEPNEAKIDSFFSLWGGATVLAVVAFFTFIMSLFFIFKRQRIG